MELPLRLSRRSTGELVYGVPLWYRIASGLVVAVLCASIAVAGGTGAIGVIVIIVSALAFLYDERWVFDPSKSVVRSGIGLLPVPHRDSFPFDRMTKLRVEIFAKGKTDQTNLPEADKMPRGSQARLIAEFDDGQSVIIDSVSWKRKPELEKTAAAIAAFCGTGLE